VETTSAGKLPHEAGTAGARATGYGTVLRRWLPRTVQRLPRTVQLCIHCRENPARFWVSRQGDRTARRPWCLPCSNGLDLGRCDVIPLG